MKLIESEISSIIFGGAKSKSAFIFHIPLIWVLNEAPKEGKKNVFDWKVYINFNTFGDVKSESAIIFQVNPF